MYPLQLQLARDRKKILINQSLLAKKKKKEKKEHNFTVTYHCMGEDEVGE